MCLSDLADLVDYISVKKRITIQNIEPIVSDISL